MSLVQKGVIETTKLKRKQLINSYAVEPRERQFDTSAKVVQSSSLLVDMLREYGLLAAVVTHLCADDLLSLALTSKALHKAIMPRSVSLQNLLGRLRCSGKGIAIRNQRHEKSTFFYDYNCTEYVQCGSMTTTRKVETKACVTCKVATCDECRIHAVYQSIYEAPSDPDDITELPNFSGFVMLKPHEHSILSPRHLLSEPQEPPSVRWQDPSKGIAGPYHDQGYLDVPLVCNIPAPPECIEDLLDLDLGQYSLRSFHGDSRYERPSPVLSSLCEVSESRKIMVCDDCFERDVPRGPAAMKSDIEPMPALPWLSRATGTPIVTCHCTLRNRFIDRWLCLRCYQDEEETIKMCTGPRPTENFDLCRCGSEACNIICLWCWGEVIEDVDDSDDDSSALDETTHG
jgi:hypothetical protein